MKKANYVFCSMTMCLIALTMAQSAFAVIAFDNASSGNSTFDHTIGGGENRMLVVGVARELGGDVAVTYGGAAMTRIPGAEVRIVLGDFPLWNDLFYLDEAGGLPAAGTHSVAVTGDAALDQIIAGAISLANVAQGAPEVTAADGDFDSVGFQNLDVPITTLSDGAMLVDLFSSGWGGSDQFEERDPTNQTERTTVESINVSGAGMVMSTLSVPTAGSVTPGYVISGGDPRRIALSIAAFAAGPPIMSLDPSAPFAIDGDDYGLALSGVPTITGAAWTKGGSPLPKAVTAGGGPTDTSVTFSPLDLGDAGLYCVTGTTNVAGTDFPVDECFTISNILPSGTTLPVGALFGLSVLSVLMACAGLKMLRRSQLT